MSTAMQNASTDVSEYIVRMKSLMRDMSSNALEFCQVYADGVRDHGEAMTQEVIKVWPGSARMTRKWLQIGRRELLPQAFFIETEKLAKVNTLPPAERDEIIKGKPLKVLKQGKVHEIPLNKATGNDLNKAIKYGRVLTPDQQKAAAAKVETRVERPWRFETDKDGSRYLAIYNGDRLFLQIPMQELIMRMSIGEPEDA